MTASADPYPILDVSAWPVIATEPAGREEKSGWLRSADDVLWLFKPRAERDGRIQGEDWAEKLASEFGALLGLPCVNAARKLTPLRRLKIDPRPVS